MGVMERRRREREVRRESAMDAAMSIYEEEGYHAITMEKIAERLGGGLKSSQFVSGNGSCDVLRMIIQTFIEPGKNAVIAAPTFSMYELLVEMFGGEVIFAPLKNFTVDLDALAAVVNKNTVLAFVCNPNNPTGTIVSHQQTLSFLEKLPPHVITVFDEAYMEFVEDPNFPRVTEFISQGRSVLVTRTFSKLHGLASLRVGYGFGRPDLMEKVKKNKLVFNSGRLAYLGAAAAVDDEEHISRSMEMVRNGRRQFYRAFDKMGLHYLPTQSNFLFLTDLPMDANEICNLAMQKGVILRPTQPFGLPDNIRITIAREKENERVIQSLIEILGDRLKK